MYNNSKHVKRNSALSYIVNTFSNSITLNDNSESESESENKRKSNSNDKNNIENDDDDENKEQDSNSNSNSGNKFNNNNNNNDNDNNNSNNTTNNVKKLLSKEERVVLILQTKWRQKCAKLQFQYMIEEKKCKQFVESYGKGEMKVTCHKCSKDDNDNDNEKSHGHGRGHGHGCNNSSNSNNFKEREQWLSYLEVEKDLFSGGTINSNSSGSTQRRHQVEDCVAENWNRRYQEALELNETTAAEKCYKYSMLAMINRDFVSLAVSYGKLIISEYFLHVKDQSIRPVTKQLGGIAGGVKYIWRGILFKLCEGDSEPYHGNDEAAAKATANDLRGNAHFINANVDGLHFALKTVIDYKGFRMIAQAMLPIDKTTIKIGTYNACKDLYSGDEDNTNKNNNTNIELKNRLRKVANILHLRPHLVKSKWITTACDIECHKGKDGRSYVIDTARLFPPEAPKTTNHLDGILLQGSSVYVNYEILTMNKKFDTKGAKLTQIFEKKANDNDNDNDKKKTCGHYFNGIIQKVYRLETGESKADEILYNILISNEQTIRLVPAKYVMNKTMSIFWRLLRPEFLKNYCQPYTGIDETSTSTSTTHRIESSNNNNSDNNNNDKNIAYSSTGSRRLSNIFEKNTNMQLKSTNNEKNQAEVDKDDHAYYQQYENFNDNSNDCDNDTSGDYRYENYEDNEKNCYDGNPLPLGKMEGIIHHSPSQVKYNFDIKTSDHDEEKNINEIEYQYKNDNCVGYSYEIPNSDIGDTGYNYDNDIGDTGYNYDNDISDTGYNYDNDISDTGYNYDNDFSDPEYNNDSASYKYDFFPPEVPTVDDVEGNEKVNNEKNDNFRLPALSSDAFSSFASKDPKKKFIEKDIIQATQYLMDKVIPSLANHLDINATSDSNISAVFHSYGVNMRHCGLVRHHVKNDFVRDLLLIEILVRTIKNIAKDYQRKWMRAMKSSSSHGINSLIVEVLNLISGSHPKSKHFWKQTVQIGLIQRFGKIGLNDEELSNFENLCFEKPAILKILLEKFLSVNGIILSNLSYKQLLKEDNVIYFKFTIADIMDIVPKVKYQYIADYYEGIWLNILAEQNQSDINTSQRLSQMSKEHFIMMYESVPGNSYDIRFS